MARVQEGGRRRQGRLLKESRWRLPEKQVALGKLSTWGRGRGLFKEVTPYRPTSTGITLCAVTREGEKRKDPGFVAAADGRNIKKT